MQHPTTRPGPLGLSSRVLASGLWLGVALLSNQTAAATPGAGTLPTPVTLATGQGSSGPETPVAQELVSALTTTEWRVRLSVPDETQLELVRDLGLAAAALGEREYLVAPATLLQLLEAGFEPHVLGGVTTHRFRYDPTTPPLPAAHAGSLERDPRGPSLVTTPGSFYLSSGTVNDAIPDNGFWWRWVQIAAGSGAPAGSTTTQLRYRLRLHNDANPANFFCGDYEIFLSSQTRGGAVPFLLVYDNLGGRLDSGFDDDAENDADIYLNLRTTSVFNGENPNQQWYVYLRDNAGLDTGFLQYIEFEVTWDAPKADLVATEVYFRDQPGNLGVRVDNPQAGQVLYPHFAYSIAAPSSLNGTIWTLDIDGTALCGFTGTEPVGLRVGWCLSPWTVTGGNHTLRGRLDPNGSFAESNENNNQATRTFTAGAPDIRVTPLSLTSSQPTPTPIYIELDWMADGTHSHRPSQAVIDRIVESFARAGYALHVEVDDAIPHQAVVAITNGSPSASPAVQTLLAQHFDRANDSRYHYSLWAHNYSFDGTFTTSSGIGDLPGRVHLVTLGSFTGVVGSFSEQAGTFAHEFGHNLNQTHGGSDHGNYKPNYLSVMNYFYQLQGIGPALLTLGFGNTTTGFDDFSYSHGLLPVLDENNLDEGRGIGLARGVDWDCDGTLETSVARDIQEQNPCLGTGTRSTLSDFDNWTSVAGNIRALVEGEKRQPGRSEICITPEEFAPLAARIDALRARGLLPADGPTGTVAFDPSPFADAGRRFTIFNDGTTNLQVSSLTLDVATPWITWEPKPPFTLAPGTSQNVDVYVNFLQAPAGQTVRRLLVGSNDPDENPYPGGVNLTVNGLGRCTVTTSSSPSAGGTTTGGTTVGCGTTVTVKAFPNTGNTFVRWTVNGTQVSTSSSFSFNAAFASSTLVAEFNSGAVDLPLTRFVPRSGNLVGASSQSSWHYYYVDIGAASRDLVVSLFNLPPNPPHDLDLYVRFGQKPTLTTHDCRPFSGGGAAETCTFLNPQVGRYWIGVNNFHTGTIGYSVSADWLAGVIFRDGFESGTLGSWVVP